MSTGVSLSLIIQAAAPSLGLVALGLAWIFFRLPTRAIAVTLFSLGIALLALMLLIIFVYSTSLIHTLEEAALAILGITPLIYAVSLILCARRTNSSAIGVSVFGVLGLIPLWFLAGFVLMNSACSFGTGGC